MSGMVESAVRLQWDEGQRMRGNLMKTVSTEILSRLGSKEERWLEVDKSIRGS